MFACSSGGPVHAPQIRAAKPLGGSVMLRLGCPSGASGQERSPLSTEPDPNHQPLLPFFVLFVTHSLPLYSIRVYWGDFTNGLVHGCSTSSANVTLGVLPSLLPLLLPPFLSDSHSICFHKKNQ